jgi:ABC-type sugar transport system substrate-binding protein
MCSKMENSKLKRNMICFAVFLFCVVFLIAQTSPVFSAEKKKLRFGMVLRDAAATWAPVCVAGVSDKCKELGIELDVQNSHNDSQLQINLMQSYLMRKVDGYIFGGSIDQAACNQEIKKFNAAGIPVIALDSCPTDGDVLAFAGSDHSVVSHRSALTMIDLIKEKNNGEVPTGKILYVVGALTDDVQRQLDEGFHRAVDAYPQLTMVTGEARWSPAVARTVTADLITSFGSERPVAAFIQYDEMMVGAMEAIIASGWDPKEMIIVTQDAGIGFEHLRNGNIKTFTTQRFYQSAQLAVETMYNYITKAAPVHNIGDEFTYQGVKYTAEELRTGAKGIHFVPEVLVVPQEQEIDWPGDTHNIADRLKMGLPALPEDYNPEVTPARKK